MDMLPLDDEVLRPDELLENADWPKRRWDLPHDPEALRALLTAQGLTPEQFEQLPAAKGEGRYAVDTE